MNVAQTNYSLGQPRAWEIEINLNAPGNSDWIIIPEKVQNISATVSFQDGGTGKIQTSTDTVYEIENDNFIAVDWPWSEISTTLQKTCKPPTAIRAVQINAGKMKVTFRGNE